LAKEDMTMGLLLEFYAGDADAIGAAFKAQGLAGLRDGSRARAHADFSLHLSPSDLDILSEVIAESVAAEPLQLNDSLVRMVGGDTNSSAAEVVSSAWVKMVAAAREAAVAEIAAEWIKRVGEEYGQQFDSSPEALRAVCDLIRLCQLADREGLAVVHTWCL
jgi:hypothetical protein